jgi:hypothetical protein
MPNTIDPSESCGYQKDGDGVCNGTIFGYPLEPLGQILADVPKQVDSKQVADIIGGDKTAATFKDAGYNRGLSRAGGLCIFVSAVVIWLSEGCAFVTRVSWTRELDRRRRVKDSKEDE